VKNILAVVIGGVLGAFVRYITDVESELTLLFINLSGVAIAGFISFRIRVSEFIKLLLIPGFAGTLTTFSSVAMFYSESLDVGAFLYFFSSIFFSLIILAILSPKVKA
jgi:fluoride ion exporter CrcB/FEX